MQRITISFHDENYEKLKSRAEKHNHPISQTARDLVDLGLKIEDAAASPDQQTKGDDLMESLVELKTMMKTNLSWVLETRLLSRFLTENHGAMTPEKRIEILSLYKQKAHEYVNEIMVKKNEGE